MTPLLKYVSIALGFLLASLSPCLGADALKWNVAADRVDAVVETWTVPELLQHEATPQALAAATLAWFDAPEKIARLERQFILLHTQLQRNTSELAAHAIAQVLKQPSK